MQLLYLQTAPEQSTYVLSLKGRVNPQVGSVEYGAVWVTQCVLLLQAPNAGSFPLAAQPSSTGYDMHLETSLAHLFQLLGPVFSCQTGG